MVRYLYVDPDHPEASVIEESVIVLRRGGVVAYPTDTVYGLAVDALNAVALARLYDVKRRAMTKAVPVIIGSPEQLPALVRPPSATAARLMAAFWPGPLTLVMEPQAQVPALLVGDSGRLGVRLPQRRVCQELARGLGRAITATSANLAGAPVALQASEVMDQLGDVIDVVLDGGAVQSAAVSTVLDVVAEPPRVYRLGKIAPAAIAAVLGYAPASAVEGAESS